MWLSSRARSSQCSWDRLLEIKKCCFGSALTVCFPYQVLRKSVRFRSWNYYTRTHTQSVVTSWVSLLSFLGGRSVEKRIWNMLSRRRCKPMEVWKLREAFCREIFPSRGMTKIVWSTWWCSSSCQYTGCHRRNGPNFGRVFLMLNYTVITQNTYIQSWTVTEIIARDVWNFDSCYTLTDCQIHIETGRNMWFL